MKFFNQSFSKKSPHLYSVALSSIIALAMVLFCGLSFAENNQIKWDKNIEIPKEKLVSAEFNTDDGNISIQPQTDPKRAAIIDVNAEFVLYKNNQFRALSEAEINQYKDKVEVAAERDTAGEKLLVHAVIPKMPNGIGISVNFKVKVPASLSVKANSSDGNIAVEGIKAPVDSKTSDGNIALKDCEGTINVITSDGNLALENCAGLINAKTSDGNIAFTGCKGMAAADKDSLTAITSDGQIAFVNCIGAMNAKTSDGNISTQKNKGPVHAVTSDGSISIQDADTQVIAETSEGSIVVSFSTSPEKECSFKNGEGSITVTLPANSKLTLNLDAGEGKVNLDRNIFTGKLEEHRADGTINGGGVALHANTGEGNITIHLK